MVEINYTENCEQCRFAVFICKDEGDCKYTCKRFPPVPLSDAMRSNYAWEEDLYFTQPTVDASDFCGEFKAKQ